MNKKRQIIIGAIVIGVIAGMILFGIDNKNVSKEPVEPAENKEKTEEKDSNSKEFNVLVDPDTGPMIIENDGDDTPEENTPNMIPSIDPNRE